MKVWNGGDLSGEWLITNKIDGVRALKKDGKWVSRAGKELYNIPESPYDDVEVYMGSWEDTITAVRTKTYIPIDTGRLFSLNPVDQRLYRKVVTNPTPEFIKLELREANRDSYEGLVLYQGDTILKVKPKDTIDVRVCNLVEGKGKHTGKLGAVITPYGKIGTGFTDEQRREYWNNPILDMIIEVEYMEMTKDNKFRHPRFIRLREDKDTATQVPKINLNSPAGLLEAPRGI